MSEVQHWICSYCGRRTITYSKEIRPDPNICHKKRENERWKNQAAFLGKGVVIILIKTLDID